ncbi:MAG: hypothetical protein MJE77_20650 [Proteobacteria bacterium]|nr:hypothetical protein [Pseudomonadota bacterium]
MMTTRSRFVVLGLLCAMACSESYIVVELQVRPTMYPATTVSVTARDSVGEQTSRTFPLDDNVFPKTLVVATEGRTGPITITAQAFDSNQLLVGTSAAATATGGEIVLMVEPADIVANAIVQGYQETTPIEEAWSSCCIAIADNGEFAVVWEWEGQSMLRMFGADARPLVTSLGSTTELPMSLNADKIVADPIVIAGADGFLTMWLESVDIGSPASLLLRPVTRNDWTQGGFKPPSVLASEVALTPTGVALASGGYAAVWDEEITADWQLRGRIVDKMGSPVGTHFGLSSLGSGAALPQCAGLLAGEFACVWHHEMDGGNPSIAVRVFNDAGFPLGNEQPLPGGISPPSVDSFPVVAAAPSGGFAVAWQRGGFSAGEPGERSLMLQLFDRLGKATSSQVRVAGLSGTIDVVPDIAVRRRDGAIAVIWADGDPLAGTMDVLMQLLHPDGRLSGAIQQVATTTDANQRDPSIAARDIDDGFIAVWTDESDNPPDNNASGVRMRVLYPSLSP